MSVEHTCIKDDGGTPNRRCYACEEEKAAAGLKLSPDDVLDVYVPGRLRCPSCKFELTIATLFVKTGQVGASKAEVYQKSEPCPNDGEPMVRVTWREEADANREYATRLIDEIIQAVAKASGEEVQSLPQAFDILKAAEPLSATRAEAQAWQPMSTAPHDATWIIAKFKDGDVRRVHYAEDLSGSEQPPFQGWFRAADRGFYGTDAPIGWMPDPPTPADEGRP